MKQSLKSLAAIGAILLAPLAAEAQMTPWFQWTFLPQNQMDLIIGEASGETDTDLCAELAAGSNNADVTADLVWVGEGEARDYEGLDVKGKIVGIAAFGGTTAGQFRHLQPSRISDDGDRGDGRRQESLLS